MTSILIAFFLVAALWITAIILACSWGVYEYIENKKINKIININKQNYKYSNSK